MQKLSKDKYAVKPRCIFSSCEAFQFERACARALSLRATGAAFWFALRLCRCRASSLLCFCGGCCRSSLSMRAPDRAGAGRREELRRCAALACTDHVRRLGHMQPAARRNLDAGEVVPAPQLAERDAEAVGDGDQRIAPARGVEHAARRGRCRRGTGTTRASTPSRLSLSLSWLAAASSDTGT